MRTTVRRWMLGLVVLGLVAAGCASDDDSSTDAGSTTAPVASDLSGDIDVSAAASLTEVFGQIGEEFTDANPETSVTFNPGPSSTLATQIQQTDGVGIDTFASADEANMNRLVTADLVDGEPVVFARNRLVIVTKPGNPDGVRTMADLTDLSIVSLCGETVPCGRYADEILAKSNVTIPETKVTRGVDVKGTLAAVTQGDADAAIVYVTDATSSPGTVVPIPDAQNVIATYPIATLAASEDKETSRAFIDFVLSPQGQATLRSYGFLPPR